MYLFTFTVFVTVIIYLQNDFSCRQLFFKMLSFLVRQIVIAIKKGKTLTYLTFFDNRLEAFSETRLSDKEL